MKEIQATDFNTIVKDGQVIVDFYGDGCPNCKMTEPFLNQFEAERQDIKFVKINIKGNDALVAEHNITTLPTLIFFKKGAVVEKLAGLKPKTILAKKIAEIY